MKRPTIWNMSLFIFTLSTLLAPLAMAQGGRMGRGMPNYDPATEARFEGTVAEVKEVPCPDCRMGTTGTHLIVESGAETREVHLGPTSFLASSKLRLAKGDRIEVVASKVKFGDGEAWIAREIKKGGETLALRDAKGVPQWSRGGRAQS